MIIDASMSTILGEDVESNPIFVDFKSKVSEPIVRLQFCTIDYPDQFPNRFRIRCRQGIIEHYDEFNSYKTDTFEAIVRIDPCMLHRDSIEIVVHWI